MTREGFFKKGQRWYPELFYIFVTAVIYDPDTGEILVSLSKDREKDNYWTLGAGGELVIPKDTSEPIYMGDTAIKETEEELTANGKTGLKISLCGDFGDLPFYSEIIAVNNPDATEDPIQRLFVYYLAILNNLDDKNKIKGRQQPGEEDCETVKVEWMSIEAFEEDVDDGHKKTFPNILRCLDQLKCVLAKNNNPFLSS